MVNHVNHALLLFIFQEFFYIAIMTSKLAVLSNFKKLESLPPPKTPLIFGKVVSFRGISSGSSPVSIGTHVRFLQHKIQLRWF